MKKALSMLGCIICLSGQMIAQVINTTFNGAAVPNSDGIVGRKVAPQYPNGDLIVFSGEVKYSTPGPAGSPLFMLTKTDANGNWARTIATNYGITMHHIIPTRRNNAGTLIAGVNTGDTYVINGEPWFRLWIVNFDDDLNTVWSRSMFIRAYDPGHCGIDIERMDGLDEDGGDLFFITFSEGSHVPGMANETDFSVLCIRENGTPEWYKSYGDYSRQPGDPLRNNEVRSLTKPYELNGRQLITIAGAARMDPDYKLFYTTIDIDGNVIEPYKLMNFQHSSWDVEPDVIWDDKKKVLMSTFETTPVSPNNPNIVTTIGLIRLNPNLSFNLGVYYDIGSWFGARNSGETITFNPQFNSNYELGAYMSGPLSSGYKMFEINSTTLWVIIMGGRVFNYNTPTEFDKAFHVLDQNNNYYFVHNVLPNANYSAISPRLIKAGPVVPTCGVDLVGMEPEYIHVDISDQRYDPVDLPLPEEVEVAFFDWELWQDLCEESGDPSNYRMANSNLIPGAAIAAYMPASTNVELRNVTGTLAEIAPTLLHSNDVLNCTVFAKAGKSAQLDIVNSLGQVVYSRRHSLNGSETKISVPLSLPAGFHVVQVAVDGNIIKKEKISVID